MQHPYFTEDGFVPWFEEELKSMLERDAQVGPVESRIGLKGGFGSTPGRLGTLLTLK